MSVEQVIKSVTANAAATIGQEDIGTLRPGAEGDAAVLELEEGDFAFDDKLGNEIRTKQRFAPTLTVKGGRRWRPK
jgi:dihydroorotase